MLVPLRCWNTGLILKGAPFHLHPPPSSKALLVFTAMTDGGVQTTWQDIAKRQVEIYSGPTRSWRWQGARWALSHLFHQWYLQNPSETDGHPSKNPWGLRDTVNVTVFWRGGLKASIFFYVLAFRNSFLGSRFCFWVWQKRRQRILKDKTVSESDSWPYTVASFPWWLCKWSRPHGGRTYQTIR